LIFQLLIHILSSEACYKLLYPLLYFTLHTHAHQFSSLVPGEHIFDKLLHS